MKYLYAHYTKDKSKFAVIMCTYQRLEHLSNTLSSLSKQTNNNFDFYICENSRKGKKVLEILKNNSKDFNNNVFVKEYHNQYSIFSRFYLAKTLAEQGYEMILFVDDDQILPYDLIENCYHQYDPSVIKSFYAHNIEGDYWSKQASSTGEYSNYVGGGGLLCNAKLFLEEDLFKCPEQYWVLDDLWLSYYLAKHTNYKMKRLSVNIKFIPDAKATARTLRKEKTDFSKRFITGKEFILK